MRCSALLCLTGFGLALGADELNVFGRALAKCDRTTLNPADPIYPTVGGTHYTGTIELRRAVDAVNLNERCQHKNGPGFWVCANVPSAGDDSEYGAWWYARSGLRPMPDIRSDAYEPDFPLRFDARVEPTKWPIAGPWCFDVRTLGVSILRNQDAFAIVNGLTCDAINEKALLALSGRDGEEQKNLLRAICTKCSVVANAEADRTDLVDICSAVAELEEPEWVEEATLE